MIGFRNAWIPGIINENIEHEFYAIRDLNKKDGVIYTVRMFDYDLNYAISTADYLIESMIICEKLIIWESVNTEVRMIIERLKRHEKSH